MIGDGSRHRLSPQQVARAIVDALRYGKPLREDAWLCGRIRTYVLPDGMEKAEYEAWWPTLPDEERDRYLQPVRVPILRFNRFTRRNEWTGETREEEEAHNIITTNGRNQILTYVGVASLGLVVPFSQFFSVGTGAIALVGAGDTSVASELFRAAPSSYTLSGNSVSISTFFGSTQANGTYTNAGLWGNNATSTLGTGTLVTHAFYTYNKVNGQSLTTSYLINLN